MSKVVQLVPESVGDDYIIDPDKILEQHKGKLITLVIIGEDEDGELVVAGSNNLGISNLLIDQAKLQLIRAE